MKKVSKKTKKTKGKFIVIDGCEGSGKSTMVKALKDMLGDRKIVVTREPGGSPFAEDIRNLILNHPLSGQAAGETQFGLFWAARFDHLKNTVKPALEKGIHVFSDRFDSSTYSHQIFGQELTHLKDFFWITRDFYLREIKPDLYVFFDVNPEEGLRRVANRKGEVNHFDVRKIDFHKRARKGYLEFLSKVPHVIIDANQSLDAVKRDFIKAVSPYLK